MRDKTDFWYFHKRIYYPYKCFREVIFCRPHWVRGQEITILEPKKENTFKVKG